jgi:hypothetical protein
VINKDFVSLIWLHASSLLHVNLLSLSGVLLVNSEHLGDALLPKNVAPTALTHSTLHFRIPVELGLYQACERQSALIQGQTDVHFVRGTICFKCWKHSDF